MSVTSSWPKMRLGYLPCAGPLSRSQAGDLQMWGESWAFGLVVAICGALHWKNYEMFCFYPNFATFCKPGSLFSSEVVWEFRQQSAGTWCFVTPFLCFLLVGLWAWFSKQCWGPFLVLRLNESQGDLRHSALLSYWIWFPGLLKSCLSPCFEFSLNPPFNVISNTSFKTQTCHFSLLFNLVL